MKPTTQQVTDEIAELKRLAPLIPQVSFFGEDNRKQIDAEIRALERGHANEDDDNEVGAIAWLEGETDDKPSDNWQVLVKK